MKEISTTTPVGKGIMSNRWIEYGQAIAQGILTGVILWAIVVVAHWLGLT